MVVAAVNRLDGRQYAVKRIRLDSASPAAFARLLREVATLSRLQHAHVVRYFQVDTLFWKKPSKTSRKGAFAWKGRPATMSCAASECSECGF